MERWHDKDDRGQTGPRRALALWSDGQPIRFALAEDADLREAVESLRAERRYLRSVLGHCARPVAVLDSGGRLLGYNTAFERMVGVPDPLGQPVARWMESVDRELLDRVLEGGDEVHSLRGALARLHTSEGGAAEVLLARLPSDEEGPMTLVLAAAWPGLARETPGAIPDSARLAQIHHDAQGMLQVGTVLLESMARSDDPAHGLAAWDALDALRWCSQILRQLSPEDAPDLEVSARAPVAPTAEAAGRMAIRRTGLAPDALRVACDDVAVALDRTSLLRVLTNLAVNAAFAVRDRAEPRVSIRTSPGAGTVLIHVEDNGVGIEPGELTRIFQAGVGSRLESGEGQGLGLAVVRQRVEAAGGSVRASSEPGEGSAFVVELPLA